MPRFVTKAAWLVVPTLVTALMSLAVAAEPDTQGKATGADGGKLAKQAFGALNELNNAVKKDASTTAATSTADLSKRPKKAVTPPTLTPGALDALVDSFLATTKAPAAAITTDVEFVRRIYLDVTGKLPSPDQTRAFVNTREKDTRRNPHRGLATHPPERIRCRGCPSRQREQ